MKTAAFYFFISVNVLQMVLMFVDEFYCHLRREVPNWERRGHPLDTLTVILCLGVLLLWPNTPWIFTVFAIFSCAFITKDEWIHKKHASSFEQWLHALLFVNHPILLWSTWQVHSVDLNWVWIQWSLMVAFMFYQIVFWNFYKPKSIYVREQ